MPTSAASRRRWPTMIVLALCAALVPLLVEQPPADAAQCTAGITAAASDDAYVSLASPNQNFGQATVLRANGSTTQTKRIFLKFAVSGVPAGAPVTAKLRLQASTTASGAQEMHPSTNISWTESTITWNNRPGFSGTVLSTVSQVTAGQYAEFDVTSWVTGNGTFAFATVRPGLTGDVDFASAEAASGRPQLVVSWTIPSAKLVPACGAWVGSTDDNEADHDVAAQEAIMGRQLDWLRLYKNSPADRFPTDAELALANGATPAPSDDRILSYSWKPDAGSSFANVAGGGRDADIDALGNYIATRNKRIVLIVHHEPEGDGPAADFIAMFRRVHDRVEARLQANGTPGLVVWGWNMQGQDATSMAAYDPGDAYYDWILANGYNWKYCHAGASWRSFQTAVNQWLPWARGNHPTKAYGVIEFATNEGQQAGESKAQWISDAFAWAKAQPDIKLLSYFHKDAGDGFCERRWDTTSASRNAWVAATGDPYFHPPH
jgi:hypothetical protein